MSTKERTALDFSRDPGAADIALAEPSRAFRVAGDNWLGRSRDKKAIDHAW